jgi:uncharacterized protein YciI
MLRDAPDWTGDEPDHERFVDSLVDRNVILLGGPFDGEPVARVSAAYVLRCSDIDEARAVVATDPLVVAGAAVATVTRWDLVGIDVDAIDDELTGT